MSEKIIVNKESVDDRLIAIFLAVRVLDLKHLELNDKMVHTVIAFYGADLFKDLSFNTSGTFPFSDKLSSALMRCKICGSINYVNIDSNNYKVSKNVLKFGYMNKESEEFYGDNFIEIAYIVSKFVEYDKGKFNKV